MRSLSKSAVFLGILALAVAGCSASNSAPSTFAPPAASTGKNHQQPWMLGEASGEDLLYISDGGVGSVLVYSYAPPKFKLVGVLSPPTGYSYLCVNKDQDIFVTANSAVLEYKHGALSPLRILSGIPGGPFGCSIDPTTGTLAVTNAAGSPRQAKVTFFKKNHGTHTNIDLPSTYSFAGHCAYDASGNLFVEAIVAGTIPRFVLLELPKNKKQFVAITLDKTFSYAAIGGMEWGGDYLDIADGEQNVIYQFAIAGNNGVSKNAITLQGSYDIDSFFVEGPTLIASAWKTPGSRGHYGTALINLYNYPAGGEKTGFLRGVSYPWSVVLSLAKTNAPQRTVSP